MSELKKQENPFNKRQRVIIAAKWSKKSAFYNWSNHKSMPLLPVDEDDDNVDYEQRRGQVQKCLEIEVDRLFRLKELKDRCMRVSPIQMQREKNKEWPKR